MERGKNPDSTGSSSSYVEGGRIAAVPSFAPEQTFLHKCADCAFNREISLHGKVCGLSSGDRPLPTAVKAKLSLISSRS